jgi:peptidyl-prolyl cis-trans isomerase D
VIAEDNCKKMALIGSIRKQSGLLVGVIGLSIVGFLAMDALNSNTSVLRGGRKDTVGVVNGEKITYNEFSAKVEDRVKNLQDRMGANGQVNDEQRSYLRNQTWDDLVNDVIQDKDFGKLGLIVTPEELYEVTVGNNPNQLVRQSFSNPQTGQFDPQQVRYFVQNKNTDDQGAEPGTRARMWYNFEQEVKKDELRQKYVNLVAKGMYIPSFIAENAYNEQLRIADFKFVQLPFSDVKDDDIKYTASDLSSYLKDHKKRYEQEDDSRKFEYVAFNVVASAQDTNQTLQYLSEKLADFSKGSKAPEDSLFVKLYSEEPFNDAFIEKDKLTSPVADTLFRAPLKSIIGPYVDNGHIKFAKIVDRKLISDSVRVAEIVFSFANVKSQEEGAAKKKLFDSIFTQLDSLKGNFPLLAATYSDDQNAKLKGGDIGWVKQGQKDPQYNNGLFFKAQKGKVYQAFTQSELIIYTVIEDRPSKPAVQVAYLSKEIVPSPETERNIYAEASKFASDNQTAAKFAEAGKKIGAQTVEYVRKNDFNIQGLGNAREVVRWVFGAKTGDVSSIISVEDKYIVANLNTVRSKGLPELDAVKDRVKMDFLRDKKIELLSKKVEEAKAGSIDQVAGKLGKTVSDANGTTQMNPTLNGMLYEPAVVAAASVAANNKVVGPIAGNAGVYVIQKVGGMEPPKANDFTSFTTALRQQSLAKTQRIQEVKKKIAKVEDNRADFF